MIHVRRLFVAISSMVVVLPLFAAEPAPGAKPDEPKKEEAKKDEPKPEEPKPTLGTVTLRGQEIAYTAKVGTLPLLKEDGGNRAEMFYVAYTVSRPVGAPERPITFCFNGGPGSAAVWLHFGGLGPRRVKLPPDGVQFEPIGRVEPNPHSVLDSTDLVFIDPVSTGHSRVAKGEKPEQFFGVDEDIEAMGEFIRLYTTREGRWASPKFVCGESYGGLRAGGLANYLQEKHGMFLSGVVLVSGVLEFQTVFAGNGNELPFITYLPSYAAVAHYHGKVAKGESLPALMEAARAFAYGDYARALLAGATLSEGERTRVAARLAEFTGLTAAEIEEVELRISPSFFRERLLRKERKILGRFDARVVSEDTDFVSPMPEFDPSFSNVIGPFSATANAYLRGELGYKSDQPYRVLSSLPWNYSKFANRYAGTSDRLAAAMKTNPKLRVFVAHGACDLAVPIGAIDYSMNHLDIPTSLRANIRRHAYDSGHMMYLYESDAERLGKDLSAFFQGR